MINPLFDIREKRYPLSDIEGLTYVHRLIARSNKIDTMPYYEIRFKDGYRWNTQEGGRYHMAKQDQPVIEYLSRQTGLPIDYQEVTEYEIQ